MNSAAGVFMIASRASEFPQSVALLFLEASDVDNYHQRKG